MRKYLYPVILFLALIIFACAASTHISDIRQQSRRYHNKVVTVSGVVKNTVTLPILGVGIYQVDDGTGTLWIKPKHGIPYKGDHITVTGKLKVGLTISGKSFGLVLIESKDDPYY
ncbi:hypothetical protein B6D60_10965 [candidate division KSB1 bacterium 4484_87]|nr:MAG: hypothetical protein B6D60_10965 [candidate division KSB1 bacterium 4484_87]